MVQSTWSGQAGPGQARSRQRDVKTMPHNPSQVQNHEIPILNAIAFAVTHETNDVVPVVVHLQLIMASANDSSRIATTVMIRSSRVFVCNHSWIMRIIRLTKNGQDD